MVAVLQDHFGLFFNNFVINFEADNVSFKEKSMMCKDLGLNSSF